MKGGGGGGGERRERERERETERERERPIHFFFDRRTEKPLYHEALRFAHSPDLPVAAWATQGETSLREQWLPAFTNGEAQDSSWRPSLARINFALDIEDSSTSEMLVFAESVAKGVFRWHVLYRMVDVCIM